MVGQGPDDAAELRALRRYLREAAGPDRDGDGLDALSGGRLPPDVVVLDARDRGPARRAKTLRAARDVVVTEAAAACEPVPAPSGSSGSACARCAMQTTADARRTPRCCWPTPAAPRSIVGVGLHATLEEFLDGSARGLASTYLTRLKVGPRLVDATAVPMLYSGQLRARHVYLVLLIGLVVVAAAIATTDVGHQWALDLRDQLDQLVPLGDGSRDPSPLYAVSLVAVLLALAIGVALGAGPLTDTGSSAATRPAAWSPSRRTPRTPTSSPPPSPRRLYDGRLSPAPGRARHHAGRRPGHRRRAHRPGEGRRGHS